MSMCARFNERIVTVKENLKPKYKKIKNKKNQDFMGSNSKINI